MHAKRQFLVFIALIGLFLTAQAQQTPAGGPPNAGRGGPGGPGGGPGGGGFAPAQTDLYHSELVKLGDAAADGLLFTPAKPGANPRVAVVTTYGPPAVELANRGYRVLQVRHLNKPGEVSTPLTGADEISRGIAYMRGLPGVQRVAVVAWGTGATGMILYADVAQRGPAACQGKDLIDPCSTAEASGLSKPDGVILLDPSLGGAYKLLNIDPAYEGTVRSHQDLDVFAAANGYNSANGTASYSAEFRKRYFAAQSARNNQAIDQAMAQLKVLNQTSSTADEPLVIPGAVNAADSGSLHHFDLTLLSHTKKPHMLLKADGTKPDVIIQSVRPASGPIGDAAIQKAETQNDHPRDKLTVRQYLANDAVRTNKDFTVTADDVIGIDWKTSNAASPAQAEGISVPTLVMTNTCFQFVVPSEIVYDHLAAKDKTYVGVEGSEHFLGPCKPEYGDTKKRLFDFMDSWLAKRGRF